MRDYIISGLSRYWRVWSKYFEPLQALNFGIGGYRTQHVLWRLQKGEIPKNVRTAIIHCGTNNIDKNYPEDIKTTILSTACSILKKKPPADIIITGLLPRDKEISDRQKRIQIVNKKLKNWHQGNKIANVKFLKPDTHWVDENGLLSPNLYFRDFLHLNKKENMRFAKKIVNSSHTHKHTSSHTTLSISPTQITTHPTPTPTPILILAAPTSPGPTAPPSQPPAISSSSPLQPPSTPTAPLSPSSPYLSKHPSPSLSFLHSPHPSTTTTRTHTVLNTPSTPTVKATPSPSTPSTSSPSTSPFPASTSNSPVGPMLPQSNHSTLPPKSPLSSRTYA